MNIEKIRKELEINGRVYLKESTTSYVDGNILINSPMLIFEIFGLEVSVPTNHRFAEDFKI